ncbi:MFS transporter [Streptomyces sp. E11-3]|uniref:MFS transporter n=1 Tax=Streptomyces sp. E11-3 TaxID=3110112 RepID=UPI0039802C92
MLLAAQFMAVLDVFIVNVAAPTIRTELNASGAGLQLVVAGYTVAYAVLLITGARLGERFGHRRVHLAGLALFTVASLGCGLSQDTGQLIAFRLIQGAGSAVMIPQVLSLIQRTFTGEGRVRALSAYSAVLAVGAAAGQVVGGVLVSADLFGSGWRPVFLVNVPIGLALLVVGARLLPRDSGTAGQRARGFDLPGLVLLGAAVSLCTVPLVLGQEQDWPLWSLLSLGSSAVLFAAFVAYEARLARRGGTPLIAPRVLRAPGIGRAATRILLAMAVNAGYLFTMALHFQSGLGHSALRTGLTFVASATAFGVVGLTWRRWPERLRGVLIPGGFVVAAVSLAAVGLTLRGGEAGGFWTGDGGLAMYVAMVGVGAGLALGFSPTLTGALATVSQEDAADASGLLATVTQLGQVVGVAAFGTLFLNRLDDAGGAADVTTAAQAHADALLICSFALAITAAAAAVSGLVRVRR